MGVSAGGASRHSDIVLALGSMFLSRPSSSYYYYRPRRTRVTRKILKAAGLAGTRTAGRLPPAVVQRIGLPTTVREVWAGTDGAFHLSDSRVDLDDVRWCVDNMQTVIEQPRYLDTNVKPPATCGLIARVTSERGLYILIKHVTASTASSGADELWIQSMWQLGEASWSRYLKKDGVVDLNELLGRR